jgi:hypothetical protein
MGLQCSSLGVDPDVQSVPKRSYGRNESVSSNAGSGARNIEWVADGR